MKKIILAALLLSVTSFACIVTTDGKTISSCGEPTDQELGQESIQEHKDRVEVKPKNKMGRLA